MASRLNRYEASEPYMGTLFALTAVCAEDPVRAFRAAFDRIAELDAKLSDYKPDSELNRLCRARRADVSDDLLTVLSAAQALAAESDGAFDVTQGPVIQLWREARRVKKLPEPAALNDAADRSGYSHLAIRGRTVTLDLPGMQIDLGAIAKGYAADQALVTLRRRGIGTALVAASGDLAIGDRPPESKGWRVGLGSFDRENTDFARVLMLSNCAVSTSGDTEQYAEIDGVRYSHIIDPHTHRPLTERRLVTVIAQRGIEADSLATAASVLGVDRGLALVERHTGVSALFTTSQGSRPSARFPLG